MPDLVADYGAVANGQYALRNVTITSGAKVLQVDSATFASGDVGKAIAIPAIGSGGGVLLTSITAFTDATHVTVNDAALATLSAVQHYLCWGTDNSTPFNNFTSASQGATTTLTIPSGTYYVGYQNPAFDGIANLTVNGTGATLACGTFQVGSNQAQRSDNSHHALTATALAGTNYVQLITPSQFSLFTVGNFALMTGYDIQGVGYPTNQYYHEFLQVSAIDSNPASPTYGKITFATPLQNTYLSTWPKYNSGGGGAPDYGGPATLYAINPTWNASATINGLTVIEDGQWGASLRNVTFNNCTFRCVTGGQGLFPTVCQNYTMNTCDMTGGSMEVDKLLTNVTLSGCTIKTVNFQSASVDTFIFSGGSANLILGSPRKLVIQSGASIVEFRPGATTYGRSEEIVLSGSTITTLDNLGGFVWQGPGNAGVDSGSCTMSSTGLYTYPKTGSAFIDAQAMSWAIPGSYIMWVDNDRFCLKMFKVLAVTMDSTNVYVQTNWFWAAGFPPYSTHLYLRTHPAPKMTVTGCSGDPIIVGLNSAPAGAPLHSYSTRTFTGSVQTSTPMSICGNLISLSMNVTKAYSGVKPTVNIQPLGYYDWTTKPSDLSLYGYIPTINCLLTGERKITVLPGGQSITGVQSGDTVPSLPEVPLWWTHTTFGYFPIDISAEAAGNLPSVTVTIVTDEGTSSQTVAPLGLRLHA